MAPYCQKQPCIALSTSQSEYIAKASAPQESMWLTELLTQIGVPGLLLLTLGTLLQDLLAELGGLCIEGQHDPHTAHAIWGETGRSQDG